jgi:hypothetical protein
MLGYFPPPPLTAIKAPRAQISSPNRPSRAYKRAGPAPHLVPHLHDQFPLLPELSIATTSAARAFQVADRPSPSISLQSLSPTKVRSGMSCPRPPLRFAPHPGRPHGLGHRRPSPLHRPAILSPLFCIVWEGGRRWLFCPYPPALFPLLQNRPPLFSLSFLSNQTLILRIFHQNYPVLFN